MSITGRLKFLRLGCGYRSFAIKGLLAIASLILAMAVSRATSNESYGPKEYVLIGHGLSPNKKYSLRAHGGGDMGYDNFHIYLFSEANHKKIGPLEEIDEVMDTGAGAYDAKWSPDSRHVAINWRTSHQSSVINMYRIEHNRAYPIKLPDVSKEIEKHYKVSLDGLIGGHDSWETVDWTSSTVFAYHNYSHGRIGKPKLPHRLSAYFSFETEFDYNPDAYESAFEGVAICKLVADDKIQVLQVQPPKKKPGSD